MSKERTNVIWTVILTSCVTAIVILVAGWFVASRYFGQQTTSAPPEVAAAPAPPRRTPEAPKNGSARSGRQDSVSLKTPAPRGAPGTAENDTAPRREDSESSSAAGRGTVAPAPEADTGRGREESEASSPAAQAVAAPPAGENHDDARTIMQEAQRRTEARSYQYEGLLQSFDAKNKTTEKRWTFERVGSHGQSKAVLRFTTPAEVKGVALLIFNHPDRASDQWMWTPAIERDRRIALQDRSTRFFGTDFSFEDLEERDVDQYDYSLLGNDTIGGVSCWKIQTTPKQSRSSQYSRSTVWIRKDNYAPAQLDNFVKDEVVRRLTYSSLENIQGIWTARQLEMAELRHGSRTRLTLQQVKYSVPMKDEDFTLQAIRHP
jgi:outer membrane lipoprotein-sorting protein